MPKTTRSHSILLTMPAFLLHKVKIFLRHSSTSTKEPHFAARSCAAWIQKYTTEQENKGLILSGDVGRGKTHLLIAIIRSLIFGQGARVRFIEFSRLLSTLRDGYSRGESNQELMQELIDVPILAIDELGKGRLTG